MSERKVIYPNSDYFKGAKETAPTSDSVLRTGGPGGTSGGMDGWQTSVEKRLDDIRTDVRDLRSGVGTLNTSAATLTERVAHLPSKGFIWKAVLAVTAFTTAVITFQEQIQTFLKLH